MKTKEYKTRYQKMNIGLFIYWLILISMFLTISVKAQVINRNNKDYKQFLNDSNFPFYEKFNIGLMTTYAGIVPPPAVVVDVTYGVSEKVSVGILGGTTGAIALAGLKMNSIVLQKKQFRIMYRMVVIYYPQRHGKFLFDKSNKHIMPWMLSMGVVDAEWVTNKGIRWALGMGLMETHCIEGMKKHFSRHHDEEKESPFEIFHTFQGSVSIPVSKKLIFRPEVITVLKGGSLIERGKFKVFPINPYLKFIYTF